MFNAIKEFFVGKPKAAPEVESPVAESAPYKVPEPAATTPIPLVVEVLPAGTEASIVAPAKKAPAKKQQYAKKNSAPRKPRTPKAS